MRHWISMLEHEPAEMAALIAAARRFKSGAPANALRGKILTMVFFNPSLRTRTSFEAAMLRAGGGSIVLDVGGGVWKLEHRDGAVMDEDRAEHIREAAPVLSRYTDLLAVRTFAGLKDAAWDAADAVIRSFARFATVPVVSMESAVEHPCQGLADWLTIAEKLGDPVGKHFVLRWAPSIKPLPLAVPHSAVLSAAAAGMNVTLVHPPEYGLNDDVLSRARQWCHAAGQQLRVEHDNAATRSGDVVYVKSWGAPGLYGDSAEQVQRFRTHANWRFDAADGAAGAIFMHCLPVRRNVVMTDAALEDPRCVVVDQAENRMWAQTAILDWLIRQGGKP